MSSYNDNKRRITDRMLNMANWQWYNMLETGIEDIDFQHKELFRRIDKLELAIYSGKSIVELTFLIKYLETYVIEHFEAEEKLMLDINFPGLSNHRKQHNEFRMLAQDIMAQCKNRGADTYMAIQVDKQMRRWWENHILIRDMEYVSFIKQGFPDKL